jgi:hypothetical protein
MKMNHSKQVISNSNRIEPDDGWSPVGTYLNRLVAAKKELMRLNQYQQISICGHDRSVHVYEGIGALAVAAGQTLTINQRNCQDYPLELSFIHQGITFYQLKSASALAALAWGANA